VVIATTQAVAISTNGVAGAAPYAIYQTKRSGNSNGPFSYTFTALVPNQTYTMKLHFGDDVSTAAGQRRFNVLVNGVQVLANFDVFATAGKYTAVVRQFTTSSDGVGSIKVDLSPAIGNPLLNGIEVIPSSLSINACGPAVGNFIADTGFNGGHCDNVRNVISTTGVADAAPAAVYQTKRTGDNYGPFNYTIAALTGSRTYTVKLHFGDDVSTAAGQRKFNVLVNGTQVLTGFDVFATGGLYHAVVKQFAASATPQGSITVTLTSAVGNPLLSGIEVIP
jgi:archaellum component FlaF (FlaF/FlaG flagellin family)